MCLYLDNQEHIIEAEWEALSEPIKEVIFIAKLLQSMNVSVELSVMVRVDNVVAIFMADNVTVTCHAKHVDIRYEYVTEYVENGLVKNVFVKSVENDSNILIKI